MIRFSLRNRSRYSSREPSDRPHKPLGPISPPRATSASLFDTHDVLPTRRSDGLALDYLHYRPSQYYQSSPALHLRHHATPAQDEPSNTTASLALDFDSVQRSQSRLSHLSDIVPLEKRIGAKIAELRTLLTAAEQLGDVEVLKDLIAIHDASLTNHRDAALALRNQIEEAKIIAGITDAPSASDNPQSTGPARRAGIRTGRYITDRTVSALKARTGCIRSASRGITRSSADGRWDTLQKGRNISNQSRVRDIDKLSRKSSARLKRLGSAGAVLIRRLSRVSMAEDASTASSIDAQVSLTFKPETMRRLKSSPNEVIAEYGEELKRMESAIHSEMEKIQEAKKRLKSRRDLHGKAMAILDQFYGGLPGWEEDPVARHMLPDTAEMTEAGLEAERDLAETRLMREQTLAARDDHRRALRALQTITSTLSTFVERLEEAVAAVGGSKDRRVLQLDGTALGDLPREEERLRRCLSNAKLAVECCVEAPRVEQIGRELNKLKESFTMETAVASRQGGLRRGDFGSTLQVGMATLCECKLAEAFAAERVKMIGEDLVEFDLRVERCEEYVMMERVGILDQYHPV